MKIQYKLSLTMIILSLALLVVIAGGFDYLNHRNTIRHILQKNQQAASNVAHHVQVHLENSVDTTRTLSTAPLLHKALQASNKEFQQLSTEKRQEKIKILNYQWSLAGDDSNFSLPYLDSEAALFLDRQLDLLPARYGEIFLTNRYGTLVAATNKITTLAHGHKYWWQAAFNKGQGKIFVDDRGFDHSVQGHVLGIVVPIIEDGEITGILKSNITIMGALEHIVLEAQPAHGSMTIARTNGLIVIGSGTEPLSQYLPVEISSFLRRKVPVSAEIDERLLTSSPVQLTLGSHDVGFGGQGESIDHSKGNTGESWHIVIIQDEGAVLAEAHKTTKTLITAVLVVGLFVTVTSFLWGRVLTRPLVNLARAAQKIGQGHLETRVVEKTSDEIRDLAHSLNEMAANLKRTMASRQELLHEVELRIQTEKELERQATTDELTKLLNRRAFSVHLKKEVQRAKRYNTPLSILMFDLDYFKKVNDTYGHDIGDHVLVEVSRLVKSMVRDQDVVARWGGEEFMVILPHTEESAAMQIGERIRQTIEEHPFGTPPKVTASIGITGHRPLDNCDVLINRVDLALYNAKSAGRNRVELASGTPQSL